MSNYWDSYYHPMNDEQKRVILGIDPQDSQEVQTAKRLKIYMRGIETAVADMEKSQNAENPPKDWREFLDFCYYLNWYGKMFVQHGHLFDTAKGVCRCDMCAWIAKREAEIGG